VAIQATTRTAKTMTQPPTAAVHARMAKGSPGRVEKATGNVMKATNAMAAMLRRLPR